MPGAGKVLGSNLTRTCFFVKREKNLFKQAKRLNRRVFS